MRKNYLHAPGRAASAPVYLSNVQAYRKSLLAAHMKLKSWRKVAAPYDLKPSMARMIAYGYDPGNKIRAKLHLQAKQVVLACSKCGEAHVTKRCTKVARRSRDLYAMPVKELRWAMENRQEI